MNGDQALGSDIFLPEEWDGIFRALSLTDRQEEVLLRLFDCMGEQAIANDLGIEVSTVHKHIRDMYLRIGVNCRMGLCLRVMGVWKAQNRSESVRHMNSGPQRVVPE